MEKEKNKGLAIFASILGLSIVVSAIVVSSAFLGARRLDNNISVSGSAKVAVVSDSARFTGEFKRRVYFDELKKGYELMKQDEKKVSDFLINNGFADSFEISPVIMRDVYKNDDNLPKEYDLTQSIELKSDDVEKTKKLAKKVEDLIKEGVFFSPNPVAYHYSKLPDARVSLLPEAIKDAKKRASAIAVSSDKKVDSIKSVSMGVVQVMSAGAIEISDYGLYDTSSIDKEIMITVKAIFNLK